MASHVYYFDRDISTSSGFMSSQRASSDAINVLEKWQSGHAGRASVQIHEGEEIICAELHFDTADQLAGEELGRCCRQFGIRLLTKADYLSEILRRTAKPGASVDVTWGELGPALTGGNNYERSKALAPWVIENGRTMTMGTVAGNGGYAIHSTVTISRP
jgi:hypothetical protein